MSLRSSEFPLSTSYKVTGSDPVQSACLDWTLSVRVVLVLVLVLILVLVLDDLPLNIRLSSSKLQEADPGSHVSIFSRSVLSGSERFCHRSEVRTNVSRSCCSTSCSTCSSLNRNSFSSSETKLLPPTQKFLCHIQNQNLRRDKEVR